MWRVYSSVKSESTLDANTTTRELRVSGCTVDKASVQHRGDTVSNTVSTQVFEPVFETGHVSYFASVHSLENWDQYVSTPVSSPC